MVPSQITAKLKHFLYAYAVKFQRKLFRLVESLFWAINFNSSQSKVRLELWYCLCILKKFPCSTDWFEEGMCIYN